MLTFIQWFRNKIGIKTRRLKYNVITSYKKIFFHFLSVLILFLKLKQFVQISNKFILISSKIIFFNPGLIISYYDYSNTKKKKKKEKDWRDECIASSFPHYLFEKALIQSLKSRVILRFYYAYELKNVKKEKAILSKILLYSIFLVNLHYFRTKMVSIEAYDKYLKMGG